MMMKTGATSMLILILFSAILPAEASFCTGEYPMLSPHREGEVIAEVDVIAHVEHDSGRTGTEVLIRHIFQGHVDTDTLVFLHDRRNVSTAGLGPDSADFTIGSSLVLGFSVNPGPVNLGQIKRCRAVLEVQEDTVSGYIRNYECPDHRFTALPPEQAQLCDARIESMSMETFDLLQQAYYASLQQSLTVCHSGHLASCPGVQPRFLLDSNTLEMPSVAIVRDGLDGSEVAEASVVLKLLNGEDGVLTFFIEHLATLPPPLRVA